MIRKIVGLCLALGVTPFANAAISSLDLGNYHLSATYNLPGGPASEASAVAWNRDSGSLFVLGDEGDAIAEVSKTGSLISTMTLSGFDDTEGLTYVGNGKFVLVEERLQDAYLLSYTAGGSITRSSLQSVSIGPTTGNTGLEGVSYDPVSGTFVFVKETNPQAVYEANLNFAAGGNATVSSLFTPALGVADLSDVQVLSGVAAGSPDASHLLIFSQESAKLLEVDRSGSVLSMFDFGGLSSNAEGVTIADDGTIYVVDEGPHLYVLTPNAPVPLPAAAWLLFSGLAGLGAIGRRKQQAA
ncbi:MAG TPA: SdiA-regulated domain-containing protein [Steroidobacteraceae bacterium]|jgi:hypothetical protein